MPRRYAPSILAARPLGRGLLGGAAGAAPPLPRRRHPACDGIVLGGLGVRYVLISLASPPRCVVVEFAAALALVRAPVTRACARLGDAFLLVAYSVKNKGNLTRKFKKSI